MIVGAGAIGCELLRNFEMLGIGRKKKDKDNKVSSKPSFNSIEERLLQKEK